MSEPNIVATIDATFENVTEIEANITSSDQNIQVELDDVIQSGSKVLYNTTESWNSRPQLIAKKGYIYVYSDYKQSDGQDIPGLKVGDGTSYLIDMPFIDKPLDDHILDTVKHITAEERTFWNNKVRCFIDPDDNGNIIFTTD